MELYSMLCASLDGRWVWGRMDTCICMAESLHYLPETTTTLLISYSVSHSVLSNSATPWTIAHEAPLSVEFSRQEYWCGSPFPSPGDLPNPGTEFVSPALAGGFFTTDLPGKPVIRSRGS